MDGFAKTTRWSVGFLALTLAATAYSPMADAGKGKLRRQASLETNKNGVVYREKFRHTKGIRSKLTFGLLGKTMGMENAQNASGTRMTLSRGRETVTRTTAAAAAGTESNSTHQKRGLIMRWKNRTTMSRNDVVGADHVIATENQHRFFGGLIHQTRTTEVGSDGSMGSVTEKMSREGQVTEARESRGSRFGRAFKGKFKGARAINPTADGMEIAEKQTKKWGFWHTVSLGLIGGGKKNVTVESAQTPHGTEVTMTTPREQVTRTTRIENGKTVSFGSFARKSILPFTSRRVRESDSVVIDSNKGVQTVDHLRRDGSSKRTETTSQYASGNRTHESESYRGDGSTKRLSVKASSARADGGRGKNWVRSRTGRFFHIEVGRVDGHLQGRMDTPFGSVGKRALQVDGDTGEVYSTGVGEAETGDLAAQN